MQTNHLENEQKIPHQREQQLISTQGLEMQKQVKEVKLEQVNVHLDEKQKIQPIKFPENFEMGQGEVIEHLALIQDLETHYKTRINQENPRNSLGLTEQEAEQRRQKYGKNEITPPKQRSEIIKYLLTYTNPLQLLLLVAAALSFIAYGNNTQDVHSLYAAVALVVIIVFNCTLEYVQERQAGNVMARFKSMLPPTCKVIRDGKQVELEASLLTLGDIVKIQAGDKIPADCRAIMSDDVKVEQSALTGEAEPIEIFVDPQHPEQKESKNILYNGCLCVEGASVGIVIRIGDYTALGKIAQLTLATKADEETGLQREIKHVVKIIGILALIMAICFFVIAIAQDQSDPLKIFVNAFVVVLVANVPQGLPLTVTTCLTIIAKRLSREHVFIKKMEVMETLGSTTVIASDKTGTITQNKMTVEYVWFDQTSVPAQVVISKRQDFLKSRGFSELYRAMTLCNKAEFMEDKEEVDQAKNILEQNKKKDVPEKQPLNAEELKINSDKKQQSNMSESSSQTSQNVPTRNMTSTQLQSMQIQRQKQYSSQKEPEKGFSEMLLAQVNDKIQKGNFLGNLSKAKISGDAGEQAVLRFSEAVQETADYRNVKKKLFEIPFNSKNKWQLSIHQDGPKRILLMKGAPEIILKKCTHYRSHGESKLIDEQYKELHQQALKMFMMQGYRVLSLAQIDVTTFNAGKEGGDKQEYSSKKMNFPTEGLSHVGLFAMMDPPKPGVADAVKTCKQAGIRVMMITGDHPDTAEAIARKVNIIEDGLTKNDIAQRDNIPLAQVNPDDVTAMVVYGYDIPKFNQKDWDEILTKEELVFARITPEGKVKVVEQLQRLKEVVAVTGDGVNDAIALKKANIGIAMKAGNDVAKDAADIIFMDDNFNSIIIGLIEGRTLFDNLRKTIAYTLTHLIPEVIPVLLTLTFGIPVGMTSLQILTIDLGTELAPAVSYAYELAEGDIMKRPPRNAHTERLVNFPLLLYAYVIMGVLEGTFAFLSYLSVYWNYGFSINDLGWTALDYWQEGANTYMGLTEKQQLSILQESQCAWYVTTIMCQVVHGFFCTTRRESIIDHRFGFKNIVFLYAIVIEISLMIIIVYIPDLQDIFATYNLGGIQWIWFAIFGVICCIWNEIRKYIARNHPKSKFTKYFVW